MKRKFEFTSALDGQRYVATLEVDEHLLLMRLLNRAARSKNRRAQGMRGAVSVTIKWKDES